MKQSGFLGHHGTSKFDLHSPLLSCSSCCSYHPDLMEGALKTLSCAIRTSARTMVLQAWVAQLVGSRCAVVLAYIPAGSIVSCINNVDVAASGF